MIFKDREEAGQKLAEFLGKDSYIKKNIKNLIVISLLRGGVVIGREVSKFFNTKNLSLPVAKISSPYNEEFAIGGLCFNSINIDESMYDHFDKSQIEKQIEFSREKFNKYLDKFNIKEINYKDKVKNKVIILVDDGIATGASSKVALNYLKSLKPKSVILAVPVAPYDFIDKEFSKTIILSREPDFQSVSKFYKNFSQVML